MKQNRIQFESSADAPDTVVPAEYQRLVEMAEALPENQEGADKTWVWEAVELARRHFEQAKPVDA